MEQPSRVLVLCQKMGLAYKDYIFSMLTPKKQGRLKPYLKFMGQDDSREIEKLFSLKNFPSVFGSESFINRIKERYYFKKRHHEIPESRTLAPEPETIVAAVCKQYNVTFDDLLSTRRGVFNEPRNVAVYLLRQMRGESLTGIGQFFNIKAYSTVSSIIQRIAKFEKTDKRIRNRINSIKNKLKGQT